MLKKTRRTSPREPAEETRKAILRAAIAEFSAHGLAGARTDAIAESAKVNKALLYYYFKSKNDLYLAAIDEVAGIVVERTLAAFHPKHSAGERLLRMALGHFDRILTQREFQSLMQQEMVRMRSGESEAMPLLVRKLFGPMLKKLQETVKEGMRSGELCEMDWLQVVYAMLGANVFYFLSAPMMRQSLPFDPMSDAAIAMRRTALVKYLGKALFVNRVRGTKLAKRVLAATPIPNGKKFKSGESTYERA
jgi:TetR/AcrR family transcriptional regulator